MKKLILFSLLAILILPKNVSAQTTDVTNAALSLDDFLKYSTKGALDDAKASIDKAIQDPAANVAPKAWVFRGQIYLELVADSGKSNAKVENGVDVARDAFEKAPSLDLKKKFDDQITFGLLRCHNNYYYMAVDPYNRGHYDSAYNFFRKAYEVSHFLNRTFGEDVDSNSLMNTAYTAYITGMNDTALRLYKEQLALGYANKGNFYHQLSDIYLNLKDTTAALNTIRDGMKKFGNTEMLMVDEINILIELNRTKEAVDKLTKAITDNPDSLKYYYVLGQKYDDLGMKEDAEKIYSSLINRLQDKIKNGGKAYDYAVLGSACTRLGKYDEADKAYASAVANAKNNDEKAKYNFTWGAMYFNRAANLNSMLDSVGKVNQPAAQQMYKDMKEYFYKAIPYLEAARSQEAEPDYATLDALKQVYGALAGSDAALYEKYKEVKQALADLQNK